MAPSPELRFARTDRRLAGSRSFIGKVNVVSLVCVPIRETPLNANRLRIMGNLAAVPTAWLERFWKSRRDEGMIGSVRGGAAGSATPTFSRGDDESS
jgi:hypothetical protein